MRHETRTRGNANTPQAKAATASEEFNFPTVASDMKRTIDIAKASGARPSSSCDWLEL